MNLKKRIILLSMSLFIPLFSELLLDMLSSDNKIVKISRFGIIVIAISSIGIKAVRYRDKKRFPTKLVTSMKGKTRQGHSD